MKRLSIPPLVIGGVALAVLAASWAQAPAKRLILNTTASAPVGFYWLTKEAPAVGDLALVRPPPQLARWLAARGYLPANVPLIKHIAAVEGQAVCARDGVVSIDGRVVGEIISRDLVGRGLSAAGTCRRLAADEVFLLNAAAPRSLDGRYFGPVPRSCLGGRLLPLWTWGR
ncbi:S26 family signal peptidase [Caulobacter hibisci]|uniref:S26 family signal peptidase n=1 Tax=Caulobacter hibisci TaxID=2035993 RepID=A0ABS0T4I7_9CAUL|nr:S26 family signal peptidase [Caulobacter hibisci]MBI1686783.1 S26 family signal peptidase [Caulobacter hibisci]